MRKEIIKNNIFLGVKQFGPFGELVSAGHTVEVLQTLNTHLDCW